MKTNIISSLMSELHGGSRRNKYMIELSWGSLNSKKFSILCTAASLPNLDINEVTVSYHGYKYHMRAEAEYPTTYEVTIMDDSALSLRKFFDTWMMSVSNPYTYKTKLGDHSADAGMTQEYMTDVNIWQLDNEGNKVYGYTLHDCFPTSIGSVEYSASDQNVIVEYPVTFTFNEFYPVQASKRPQNQ